MKVGFSIIKFKPFYSMKQIKYAKNGKRIYVMGKLQKYISLNRETVGIQTCGEIPMDINLFLGH